MASERARVLIACEFSGVVRRAFQAAGCDAWSCDLLPAEDGSSAHLHCDVRDVIEPSRGLRWDLIVAHPPCTYLANSGVRWLYEGGEPQPERWALMREGAAFFRAMLDAPCYHVCVENPIMHRHARLAADIPVPTQIIQPWQFGHGETKATCLWLRGLPKLKPTQIVAGRKGRVHREPPGPDRWKARSRTYQGVAAAMAAQWAPLLMKKESLVEETVNV